MDPNEEHTPTETTDGVQQEISRRQLAKLAAAAGLGGAAYLFLPTRWSRPMHGFEIPSARAVSMCTTVGTAPSGFSFAQKAGSNPTWTKAGVGATATYSTTVEISTTTTDPLCVDVTGTLSFFTSTDGSGTALTDTGSVSRTTSPPTASDAKAANRLPDGVLTINITGASETLATTARSVKIPVSYADSGGSAATDHDVVVQLNPYVDSICSSIDTTNATWTNGVMTLTTTGSVVAITASPSTFEVRKETIGPSTTLTVTANGATANAVCTLTITTTSSGECTVQLPAYTPPSVAAVATACSTNIIGNVSNARWSAGLMQLTLNQDKCKVSASTGFKASISGRSVIVTVDGAAKRATCTLTITPPSGSPCSVTLPAY